MSQIGPVQVIPPGLLGFLQLKGLGENPSALLQEYQPSIEVRDWLMAARYEVAIGNTSSGANGFQGAGNLIVVPQNECWFVHFYGVRGQLAVAGNDMTEITPVMILDVLAGNNPIALAESHTCNRAAAGVVWASWVVARSFFAPPGAVLSAQFTNVTAGPANAIAATCLFTRLSPV